MRIIDSVWLDMTTKCNRKCPECSCNIPNRKGEHYSWAYFENLARYIHGIHRVHLTGGEPTAHPMFAEFVPRFKALFGCELLTLWTNGFRVREYAATLEWFDEIFATRHPDNHDIITWLVEEHGVTFLDVSTHIPRARRGGGNPCGRGTSDTMVIFSDGRLFPCCAGPGITVAQSMELCEGWRTKILDVPMPCRDCWFSI